MRRLAEASVQSPLELHQSLRRPCEASHLVDQNAGQDPPQPDDQFPLAAAAELTKSGPDSQERLLDRILRVDFSLQLVGDLHLGQKMKVPAVDLEEDAERRVRAYSSAGNEPDQG